MKLRNSLSPPLYVPQLLVAAQQTSRDATPAHRDARLERSN
ncbi:hypothetical protein CDS [Bradyrhizobium sp.]|nr:hypothetical protein CDS [Bradyrhizobium sp.]